MARTLRAVACAMAAVSILLAGAAKVGAAGAMAVGTCAAYGYAYDFADAERARTAALGRCGAKACQVVATINRGCAALAVDGRNVCGPHGYAVASRLGRAQNTALRECYKQGGSDCVIRAWACDAKG